MTNNIGITNNRWSAYNDFWFWACWKMYINCFTIVFLKTYLVVELFRSFDVILPKIDNWTEMLLYLTYVLKFRLFLKLWSKINIFWSASNYLKYLHIIVIVEKTLVSILCKFCLFIFFFAYIMTMKILTIIIYIHI